MLFDGFTLLELLVTISVIFILVALLGPALVQARRKATDAKCLNQLHQLSMATSIYASDYSDELPPRRRDNSVWFYTLKPYYNDLRIILCPRDRPGEWRSYLINGFNDYWESHLSPDNYNLVMNWGFPHGMQLGQIPEPSGTIVLGEKRKGSVHAHMDLAQGQGNDKDQLAHNMHWSGLKEASKAGGSYFSFADCRVQFLKYAGSVRPINLWATSDQWRKAPVEVR